MHVKSCDCFSNTNSSAIPFPLTHSVKQDKKRKRAILIKTNSIIVRLVAQQQHIPKHVEKYQGIRVHVPNSRMKYNKDPYSVVSVVSSVWGLRGGKKLVRSDHLVFKQGYLNILPKKCFSVNHTCMHTIEPFWCLIYKQSQLLKQADCSLSSSQT